MKWLLRHKVVAAILSYTLIILTITAVMTVLSSVHITADNNYISFGTQIAGAVPLPQENNYVKVKDDPFTPPTLTFHSGFENNATSGLGEWDSVFGTVSIATTPVVTGTYSLKANPTNSNGYVQKSVGTVRRITFDFYINTAPNAECIIESANITGGHNIRLTNDRYLELYAENTLKGTSAAPLSTLTWYRISYSNSTVDGASILYVDGIAVITLAETTGIPTGMLGIYTASITAVFYYDNVAYDNNNTSKDIGDIRTVIAIPNLAGTFSDFDTPTGNTTAGQHFRNINDSPASINDATYNLQAGSTQVRDSYNLPDVTTLGISNVVAVNVLVRSKSANTNTNGGITVTDNGTFVNSLKENTTSITWFNTYYATRPNEGNAWTDTSFNSLEIGVISTGTTRDWWVYTEWAMVAYGVVPGDPSSLASPSQTDTTISLTWTKGTQADNTTIRQRSDGTYPTSITDGTLSYNGTASSFTVQGLTASTTYKFRAWAYSSPLDLYSTGTSDLTQATSAGSAASYTANATTYNFGVVAIGSTTNTSGVWIKFTNASSVTTNISVRILANTWTATAAGWTHSDTAAGANTAAMKANSSNNTNWSSSVFIKYTAPFNEIAQSIPVGANVVSGISLLAPTSVTNGNTNNNTVRFSFYAATP